ncbi:C-type lectin domain family 4 member F [Ochotona curzoniae]|uniref:C-type lectin domain family 4 member F n=1 Tax=Ochotona curzoniae TaxID=130825 RepID=UPI001B349C93|nr:C-type lectin domain family 4 member F [Ochotona curzoniae]
MVRLLKRHGQPFGARGWEQCRRMKATAMSSDTVHFCTEEQCVFLQPQGADSTPEAPAALRRLRFVQATIVLLAMIIVSYLVAVFVMALQSQGPAPEAQRLQAMLLGDNATGQSPVDPNNYSHTDNIKEVQEVIQMFKSHVENSSPWGREIQMLMCRVDNISSQLQVLSGHLENASADMQSVRDALQAASTWSSQTQTSLQGSLDSVTAELQVLRGRMGGAGSEILLLKEDLENHTTQTDAQFQLLKAKLEDVNSYTSQIQAFGDQLNKASREIETLRQGMADTEVLSSQARVLENDLKQAVSEQQRRLETALASQEQLHKTQARVLRAYMEGWKFYRGNLYYFSEDKKSWHQAEQFCVSQGTHLASVTSGEEQAFLTQVTSSRFHWIGLTDGGTEGSWRWTDGTPFSSTQSQRLWDAKQPDNWRHSNGHYEDCVHIQKKWNDMDCDTSYHWVCKMPTGLGAA